MREGFKGCFATVSTLARVSYATEGQGGDGTVEERIVDSGSSGCYFVED
jgi:hypothetical protein